ncbi:gliding motility-associated C-terminal domain-containing protein [Chitinophaga ginsengisoli]|uniref:Gliding motility-associated-like protein n=1 Tax=Chitinophaga ginsengisoli TaxID=363837 RepID=A0A2P8G4Z4_9BACT|nr:gliding motility-associated C-terminal domain-containing protein [Chitinophaga ginsengisoli]PSL29060.1 gliding motility-associated-like protein [Chitinophaga ginsengisoli]
MPKNFKRILLTIVSMLSIHYSFSAVIYVNINNPTPGTGTSWATAYNDLNAAIAAAPAYSEIWVAQGTYKPTTGTDRTIAFTLPIYMTVYGGFNGTEVNRTDRNPVAYPTILSGDIGVPGDLSDNSYNVVRATPSAVNGTIVDGFTIRDGNANQGYPGSTAIQPYNQGGGVTCISYNPNWTAIDAVIIIQNCHFTNNFAVYGGAVCNFTYGTSAMAQTSMLNCVFDNNTAVMGGGAMALVSINAEVVYNYMLNCVFVNNNSGPGTASCIAAIEDNNSSAGAISSFVYNSVFYNEAAPVATNEERNGGVGYTRFYYDILWGTTPYPDNTFNSVGHLTYGTCDFNINTPPAGNTNLDPQFVDAANGNYHVAPCSPVIDYGGFAFFTPWNVDYDGNARVQNSSVDLGIYETSKTVSSTPFAAPATYCQGQVVTADLSNKIALATGTLNWYSNSNLSASSLLPGAPTASTAATGVTYYYVTQTVAGTCESKAAKLTVTVNPSPGAPATSPVGYCQNAASVPLTATMTTGTYLRWYVDNTTPTWLPGAPSPSTATTGNQTWYVSQIGTNGCESPRAVITVSTGSAPLAPVTAPISYCQNATAVALDATGDAGATLNWYSTATSTPALSAAPVPVTNVAATTAYYVSQTSSGCESPRVPLAVTVNAAPAAPTSTNTSYTYCQFQNAQALNATGTGLQWYNLAAGGTPSSSTPVVLTTGTGTTDYYVSQTVNGCESPRLDISVTVNAAPAAPTSTNATPGYCLNATPAALQATGTSLIWYDAATNGNVYPVAPTPSTSSSGITDYYVSQTVGGCESPRLNISVTVTDAPTAPVTTDATYCQNMTATPLTATGSNLLWYDAGGTVYPSVPTPSTSSTGTTDYYVSQTVAGCESPRATIVINVNAIPSAPVTSALTYCQNTNAAALTALGTSLTWYDAQTGGTAYASAPQPSTATIGAQSFYVSQTVNGCESPRAPLAVTVQSQPAGPATSDITYCQNAPATALTATGSSLRWYYNATGGTGYLNAPTPSTTESGITTYYVSESGAASCESVRSPLTVTVNPSPSVTIAAVNRSYCKNTAVPLTASGASSYSWTPTLYLSDPAISNPTATLTQSINYTVTGTDDNGCTGTAQVALNISDNCGAYTMPTAFSPNGDGQNDLFRVATENNPQAFHMEVYNRYGGKVFETSDITIGWDGTQKGLQVPVGTYAYFITIKTSDGSVTNKTGSVTLIR